MPKYGQSQTDRTVQNATVVDVLAARLRTVTKDLFVDTLRVQNAVVDDLLAPTISAATGVIDPVESALPVTGTGVVGDPLTTATFGEFLGNGAMQPDGTDPAQYALIINGGSAVLNPDVWQFQSANDLQGVILKFQIDTIAGGTVDNIGISVQTTGTTPIPTTGSNLVNISSVTAPLWGLLHYPFTTPLPAGTPFLVQIFITNASAGIGTNLRWRLTGVTA